MAQRWVSTSALASASSGSQGGLRGWEWGWHHSPKGVTPLWQHWCHSLGLTWGPAVGQSPHILLGSLLWDFRGIGTSGFASLSLERRVPCFEGHLPLFQTVKYFGDPHHLQSCSHVGSKHTSLHGSGSALRHYCFQRFASSNQEQGTGRKVCGSGFPIWGEKGWAVVNGGVWDPRLLIPLPRAPG